MTGDEGARPCRLCQDQKTAVYNTHIERAQSCQLLSANFWYRCQRQGGAIMSGCLLSMTCPKENYTLYDLQIFTAFFTPKCINEAVQFSSHTKCHFLLGRSWRERSTVLSAFSACRIMSMPRRKRVGNRITNTRRFFKFFCSLPQ